MAWVERRMYLPRLMRALVASALISIFALAACASADDGAADAGSGADARTSDDGGASPERDASSGPTIEVGTGADQFEPLVDGQGIALNRGPQGGDPVFGFHVWIGVRAHGLEPRELDLAVSVHTATTSEELATGAFRVNLEPSADGDVTYGLRALLSNCCHAEHKDLSIRIQAADVFGKSASDEVRVRAGECPPGLPNPTIDPCP